MSADAYVKVKSPAIGESAWASIEDPRDTNVAILLTRDKGNPRSETRYLTRSLYLPSISHRKSFQQNK